MHCVGSSINIPMIAGIPPEGHLILPCRTYSTDAWTLPSGRSLPAMFGDAILGFVDRIGGFVHSNIGLLRNLAVRIPDMTDRMAEVSPQIFPVGRCPRMASSRASLIVVAIAALAVSPAFASRSHHASSAAHAGGSHKVAAKSGLKSESKATAKSGAKASTRTSARASSRSRSRSKTRGSAAPSVATAAPVHKLHGQQAIDSERVTQIQQALIREHYLDGEATGQWDSSTVSAMQKFQADQGWQTKLTPDSRALKKLGLGPDYSGAINARNASFNPPASARTIPPDQAAGFAAAAKVN